MPGKESFAWHPPFYWLFLFPDTNPIGSHRKSKQDSRELYQNFCLLQQKTVEFGTISLYI